MLSEDAQQMLKKAAPQGAPGVWTERGGEAPGASVAAF